MRPRNASPPVKLTASQLPPPLREIAVVLGDYVGTYRGPFGVLEVVRANTHLQAQITGQPAFPIYASARDRFFYKIVDAQLDFERDAGGHVVAVVLHQNGSDLRAPRLSPRR